VAESISANILRYAAQSRPSEGMNVRHVFEQANIQRLKNIESLQILILLS